LASLAFSLRIRWVVRYFVLSLILCCISCPVNITYHLSFAPRWRLIGTRYQRSVPGHYLSS
jgi:hypothetical protein